MSQLAKLLSGVTLERVAPQLPLSNVCDVGLVYDTQPDFYKRELRVTFKTHSLILTGALTGKGESVSDADKRMKRQIIEQVFGEFRVPILTALNHACNYEYEKTKQALDALLDAMFNIDV